MKKATEEEVKVEVEVEVEVEDEVQVEVQGTKERVPSEQPRSLDRDNEE